MIKSSKDTKHNYGYLYQQQYIIGLIGIIMFLLHYYMVHMQGFNI